MGWRRWGSQRGSEPGEDRLGELLRTAQEEMHQREFGGGGRGLGVQCAPGGVLAA